MGRELPTSGRSGLPYIVVPVALVAGEALAIWGGLELMSFGPSRRWAVVWAAVVILGSGLVVGGIGAWMGRRWDGYLLSLAAGGMAAGTLMVASGIVLRSIRLSLGGPMLPLVGALVAGLIAVTAWMALTGRSTSLAPMSGGRTAVATIAAILVVPPVLGMALVSAGAGWFVQCDGTVPLWMVPDDYDGGGCVALRPFWEAMLPWHWGEWREVCLGMCLDLDAFPGGGSGG